MMSPFTLCGAQETGYRCNLHLRVGPLQGLLKHSTGVTEHLEYDAISIFIN